MLGELVFDGGGRVGGRWSFVAGGRVVDRSSGPDVLNVYLLAPET
jgi:hypothetical protein